MTLYQLKRFEVHTSLCSFYLRKERNSRSGFDVAILSNCSSHASIQYMELCSWLPQNKDRKSYPPQLVAQYSIANKFNENLLFSLHFRLIKEYSGSSKGLPRNKQMFRSRLKKLLWNKNYIQQSTTSIFLVNSRSQHNNYPCHAFRPLFSRDSFSFV